MAKQSETDEFKLMGLLWRDVRASSRSGLSTTGATKLAVALADREGLEAVTIRRLADEAGVTSMALYPHIGGRAELVELMLDHVAGLTYEGGKELRGETWRDRVMAVADANWAICHAHPWITGHSFGRTIPGPGASAKFETELGAFDGIGLTDVEMDHALTALLSMIYGTARSYFATQASKVSSNQDDDEWWSNIEARMPTALGSRARFPTAARVSRSLGEETGKANDPGGAYRYGVALFLDGIAKQVG